MFQDFSTFFITSLATLTLPIIQVFMKNIVCWARVECTAVENTRTLKIEGGSGLGLLLFGKALTRSAAVWKVPPRFLSVELKIWSKRLSYGMVKGSPSSSSLAMRLPSLGSSGHVASPPTAAGSSFPGSAVISPLDSISVLLKFYSQHHYRSSLAGQFLLSMNHLGKMSHGFFTGREESITATCFATCVGPERGMPSHLSLTDLERSDAIGH